MPSHREEPHPNFSFVVLIDGIADGPTIEATFSEVSGLDVEIVPIEYRAGADTTEVRKIPGLRKFTNVTLKRGITGDLALWNWLKATIEGEPTAANVTVSLVDQRREPVMSWHLYRAWPCRLTGPVLRGSGNEIAVESLELCHEGMTLA